MIIAKLDVSKIDKSKLYKGEKGTYLELVLMETKDDKYGNDFMVVQGVTKEDREAGVKGAILGNAKNFVSKQTTAKKSINRNDKPEDLDDQMPF